MISPTPLGQSGSGERFDRAARVRSSAEAHLKPSPNSHRRGLAEHSRRRQNTQRTDLLQPMRQWLEAVEVDNPKVARFLCKLIPASCPFERDIKFCNHLLFHIPAFCKLNPLYEQVVGLRFRSLSYLADECGEDVTLYC